MKKQRFLFSLLMALVMVAISPQKAWALGGSGTSSSPYTISSAADLVAFASKVNGGETGAYAKLTADITLTSAWTPIGNSSKIYTGTFDGQGHTISGFSMEGYTIVNAGFFGYVNGATIKNFTLNGTMTSSTQITGGENDCSGAVVGRAMGSSTIQDIVSNVNITLTKAQKHLGGVVGAIEGSTVVKGCTYTGTLDAGPSTDCIGGIVGFAPASCSGSIFYCFFNGTLSSSSSTPTMGGILGYTNDESNNFSGVHDCYSCGTFSFGASDYKYVNAIVGRIRNRATTTINNTYLSGIATRACNTDGPSIPASNKAITISVTSGSNGTVSHSYVNPSTEQATQLQVAATPNAHYHLNKWSDSGAQTHNVGLTNNVDLSATFAIDQHTITVKANDGNMGTVSGGGTFDYGSTKTITATAKAHYHFVKWNDGDTNASRSITVTEDKTYTATFAIDQHTITVQVASGQGNMGTVSGGGTFDYNSTKTITATPKAHYHFVQWNDGNTNASRTITVTGNATYTATFAIDQHTITVQVASGQGSMGTVSGGGTFDYGSTKTITATPKEHYHFVQWSDGNTDASRQIMVNGNATYTATFAIDQHTITVQANNSNYGTVSGSGTYNYGTQQTITATPEEHYHFVQWSDGNTDASRQIMVNGNATYTATFAIDQHTITVQANNDDYGTVTGSGTFDYNSQQTITATPEEHYHFVQWSDGNTNASRQITVEDDATYTATFAPKAKAVLNNGTLTFYYDDKDHDGVTYQLNEGFQRPGWWKAYYNDYVSSVVFDETFAGARPTSCFAWFANCSDLTSISGLAYLNTECVTILSQMFLNCQNITSLDLSSFNTTNVELMGLMFKDCANLSSITFGSNFNTEKVSYMNEMFSGCSSLQSLDLRHFNTEKVLYMDYMFSNCTSLQSLNLSSFSTVNVEEFEHMFDGCQNLQSLTIGNFDMQTVAATNDAYYSSDMFTGCDVLNTLTLKSIPFLMDQTFNTQFTGDGMTVNLVLDENSQIYEGTNYLPTITNCNHYKHCGDDLVCTLCGQAAITHTGTCGTCTWTIYENGHMIIKPTEGETGTLAKWNDNVATVPWSNYRRDIKSIQFWDKVIAQTCDYMFYGCSNLKTIDFANFDTKDIVSMYRMFDGCSSLQSLDLSSFNTVNVTNMYGMFSGCSSLQSLDLSSFNTVNVTNMVRMFSGCSSLQSLDFSSFNTASVTNMGGMFDDCSSLQTLDLSSFNTANVTNMGAMFDGCSSLQTLDLSSFNTANVTNMNSMFYDCTSLQSLDLRDFNTANVQDLSKMFSGCSALQSLDLSSFNTANVEAMAGMFSECYSLATLKLSNDFVLNEGVDKDNLFQNCGKNTGQLLIYYVIDESIKEALQSSETTYGGYFREAEFVPSAIVKDGVPFNVTRGWAWDIPAENVVFTRQFTAEKPASAMLPFEVAASQINGATFYEFKGVKYENNEWVADMTEVTTVREYTPYVVITSGTGITFTGDNIMFQSTEVVNGNMTQTDAETGWTFVALNEFKRWEAGDEEIGKAYGFAGKNKDYDDYSVAKGEFVKIGAGASAKPGRCYLVKNDGEPLAAYANGMRHAPATEELPITIKVRFIEGNVTGIGTLNTETGEMSSVQWYDLNGNKIEQPSKGGIYIKNNKKVMVK